MDVYFAPMTAMESNQFYYQTPDGKERGPVTLDYLISLHASHQINALTKIRSAATMLWQCAIDLPELAQVFSIQSQPRHAGIAEKPLSQITVGEIPSVIVSLIKHFGNWIFFFFYIPASVVILSALWELWSYSYAAKNLVGTLPNSIRSDLPVQVNLTFPVIMLAFEFIAPLAIWICYWKKKLNFYWFVVYEFSAQAIWFVTVLIGSAVMDKSANDQLFGMINKMFDLAFSLFK